MRAEDGNDQEHQRLIALVLARQHADGKVHDMRQGSVLELAESVEELGCQRAECLKLLDLVRWLFIGEGIGVGLLGHEVPVDHLKRVMDKLIGILVKVIHIFGSESKAGQDDLFEEFQLAVKEIQVETVDPQRTDEEIEHLVKCLQQHDAAVVLVVSLLAEEEAGRLDEQGQDLRHLLEERVGGKQVGVFCEGEDVPDGDGQYC